MVREAWTPMPRTTPKEQEAREGAGLDYIFLGGPRSLHLPHCLPAQLEQPGTIEK